MNKWIVLEIYLTTQRPTELKFENYNHISNSVLCPKIARKYFVSKNYVILYFPQQTVYFFVEH